MCYVVQACPERSIAQRHKSKGQFEAQVWQLSHECDRLYISEFFFDQRTMAKLYQS